MFASVSPVAERLGMSSDDSTSSSLLRRAIAREPDAWQRLLTYIRRWCATGAPGGNPGPRRTGCVAGGLRSSLSSLAKFRADRPGTTYRAWMRGIARHKLHDYLQRRGEPAPAAPMPRSGSSRSPHRRMSSSSPRSGRCCCRISACLEPGPASVRGSDLAGVLAGGRRDHSPARSPRRWGSPPTPSARPSHACSDASRRRWAS